MKLRILNCKDELKSEIRQVVYVALQVLLKGRKKILKNVRLTIKIDDKETDSEQAWGLCYWADRRHSPRKFVVVLNSRPSRRKRLEVLAHELVHVKQYLIGDLKDYCSGAVRWKKKRYQDTTEYEKYINTPWEKEAYHQSRLIIEKYLNQYS